MLRVSMFTQKKFAVKTKFTDFKNDVKILLMIYLICLLELNLHHMCHAVVIIESALNTNTIIQTIEQVHHLSQKYHQNIWILFDKNTFNQFVKYNAVIKMIDQIINIDHESFQNLICRWDNVDTDILTDDSDDFNNFDDSDDVSNFNKLINKADSLLCDLLEQQKNQLKWSNFKNITLIKENKKQVDLLLTKSTEITSLTKNKSTIFFISFQKSKNDSSND